MKMDQGPPVITDPLSASTVKFHSCAIGCDLLTTGWWRRQHRPVRRMLNHRGTDGGKLTDR